MNPRALVEPLASTTPSSSASNGSRSQTSAESRSPRASRRRASIATRRSSHAHSRCHVVRRCYIAPMPKPRQLELHLPTHGGKREGAGRPREAPRPDVAHVRRAPFSADEPLQITLRLVAGLPSLRGRAPWAVIVRVLRSIRGLAGFRIVEYSVLSNHLHLVVEADDAKSLTAGMRGLTGRLARRLNGLFGRSGPLFGDRYHARPLGSPREVRLALQYVLLDHRKHEAQHGRSLAPEWIDPRSSGPRFTGWCTPPHAASTSDYGTSPAQTWLLAHGWRRCGLLRVDAVPGATAGSCARSSGS